MSVYLEPERSVAGLCTRWELHQRCNEAQQIAPGRKSVVNVGKQPRDEGDIFFEPAYGQEHGIDDRRTPFADISSVAL